MVKIGTTLSPPIRLALISFLPGISPDTIYHRLSIDPKTKPVRQKRKSYDAERYKVMKAETGKLKGIGFIREVNYPTWVTNVILVKKNPTKESLLLEKVLWRMCVDYTDLNKECLMDSFPLPLTNLSETFTILKRYRMTLNPNKCAFGVGSGKFLGFMISQRGIKANPKKIKAILDMKESVTSKEIQSLTGKVAALTRFISKATDRCAPFFKAPKGNKKYITWTDECVEAFKNLKYYMSKALLLPKPEVGDTLIIYLSVSASAVSSVLIRNDGNVEWPIYYASKALQDAERRYSNIQKLALALVMSARKLRPYFQAHFIIVLTNHPLQQILQSPDTSGRMIK
ncbi:hypothetical protein ACFX2C_013280 [Malus domestica]